MTNFEASKKRTKEAMFDDPSIFPAKELSCVNRRCAGFREPERNKIVFHGEFGHYLGLECLHCHTQWKDTGALFRLREGWNTPYYGLTVSLVSAFVVWPLPFKLLPWSEATKWFVTASCLLAAIMIVFQLWRRHIRWYALRQLGFLGHPENAVIPSEVAAHLTVLLEGKSSSMDGKLKEELLQMVQKIQQVAVPILVQVKHILGLLERVGFDEIQNKIRSSHSFRGEEAWVRMRLSWFQVVNEEHSKWVQNVRLGSDLFETIVGELETLKLGEPNEKEEARRILNETLQDGAALLSDVKALQTETSE